MKWRGERERGKVGSVSGQVEDGSGKRKVKLQGEWEIRLRNDGRIGPTPSA